MAYEAVKFDHLLGLAGFSDTLLKNHFTLYQGYVTNTNKLGEFILTMMKDGKQTTPEFAELKRRFGWEFNGMRLHELYFGNLSTMSHELHNESVLMKKIISEFGSFDTWEKEMRAVCAIRGIGWGILYYDVSACRLTNCWINEHDVGHLSGCVPLLVIDIFEHAFITDYGIKRADYLEAVFNVIDWHEVERRFQLIGGK